MRFALLCDDPSVEPWLDVLTTDPTHELTLAATLTPAASDLLRGRSGIRLTPHWEDLVQANAFDAVLVGGHDERTLDAIKQLASSGQTLLYLPNALQGSTFIYELSLIRDDNRVSIYPAVWQRCDPALIRVREALRSGTWGKVHLFQLQCELPANTSGTLISQSTIDSAMLLDIDLLRWLSGDYDQITALRVGASENGLLTQSVKLSGRDLPEAIWDVRTGPAPTWKLTIQTDRGIFALQRTPQTNWTVTEPDGTHHSGDCVAAAGQFLQHVQAESKAPIEWHELVKAFETVDATHRSVKRRRTIDLHFEPMSERAIFKTQMTAIGCSVLMATFLLVLLYLAIASTIPLPEMVLLLLRTLIFAPLGIFLVLQLLYPLTRPSQSGPQSPID